MAADNFWNNREQAQKLIEEASLLRDRTEPLLKAEKQLEDFQVMVELGEAEPVEAQDKIQQELERDLSKYFKELDALELKVFLDGPHDRSNCIISINSGAGGTESCDWANMLMRMYQRWAESRGWEVEVSDVLVGESAGIKSATLVFSGENALRMVLRSCETRSSIRKFTNSQRRDAACCVSAIKFSTLSKIFVKQGFV